MRIGGETRTNIKIADRASGDTTDVNLPGLTVSDSVFDDVRATLTRDVAPGRPVVLAGSLPESMPETAWATLAGDLAAITPASCSTPRARPLAAALASGRRSMR